MQPKKNVYWVFGILRRILLVICPKKTSDAVLKGLKAGKKIKARVFDFVPKF